MKSTLLAFIGLLLPISIGSAGTPVPLADAQMDMVSAGQFDVEAYATAINGFTANVESKVVNWVAPIAACAISTGDRCTTFFPPPRLPSAPLPNQFLRITDLPR